MLGHNFEGRIKVEDYQIGDVITFADGNWVITAKIIDIAVGEERLYVVEEIESPFEKRSCTTFLYDELAKLSKLNKQPEKYDAYLAEKISCSKYRLGQMVSYKDGDVNCLGMVIKRGIEDNQVVYTIKNADGDRPVILENEISGIPIDGYYPVGVFENLHTRVVDNIVMGSVIKSDLGPLTGGTKMYHNGQRRIIDDIVKTSPYYIYKCTDIFGNEYEVDGRYLSFKPQRRLGLK